MQDSKLIVMPIAGTEPPKYRCIDGRHRVMASRLAAEKMGAGPDVHIFEARVLYDNLSKSIQVPASDLVLD